MFCRVSSLRCSCRGLSSSAIAWLLVLAAGTGAPSQAEERPLSVEKVQVGWQDKYKAGCWTTVRVTLKAHGTGVQGTVQCRSTDGDNVPVTYANNVKLNVSAGQTQEVILPLQAGGVSAKTSLEIQTTSAGSWSEPLKLPPPLAATREIVASLGPAIDVAELPRYIRRREDFAFVPVSIDQASDLPLTAAGYADLEIVVLPLSRASLIDEMSDKQLAALLQWVQGGGRLILTTATRGPQLLGPGGRLAAIAPGKIRGVVRMRRTIGIESAGGAAVDIDTVAAGRAPFVLDYENYQGRVDLWESQSGTSGQPLVVRSAYGFGQVQIVGLDLDQPPWSEWPGRPRFIADLIADNRSEMASQEVGVRGEVTHLGYDDLTGQLRTALEQFTQVTFLSFTVVAVIAGLYLILIGPVDYFLIRSLRLPRHLTWGTLLAFVALASGIGWTLADRSHGRQLWINQTEIVDVDVASGAVRGVAWMQLYSPASLQYNLRLQPTQESIAPAKSTWLSWQGLAGHGLGGLSVPARNFQPSVGYEVIPGTATAEVQGLPVPFAGSKGLRAEWTSELNDLKPSALRSDNSGRLFGEVTNPLPYELTDCRLIYREDMFRLRQPLPAGGTVLLSSLQSVDLQSRLTERVVLDQQDRATPWDAASTNVPRIIEMLMFHEAARGSGYTQLAHRYQPTLDFSGLIQLQPAVLVGRTTAQQSDLVVDDVSSLEADRYDQRWTWIRVLIPVQTASPTTEDNAS